MRVWLLFLRKQKGVVIISGEEGGCDHSSAERNRVQI